MNTPAHLIINLALLQRPPGEGATRWILAGALLPDLPIFGFYVWQRLVLGASERHIWDAAYFEASWQDFFDVFNSIPLFALAGLAALALRQRGPALLCASALLHQLCDLGVHREDAHGHFWPFTEWHFLSPVSYWDPEHHGASFALFETWLVVLGSVRLWPGATGRGRAALVAACALGAAGWIAFYAVGWEP